MLYLILDCSRLHFSNQNSINNIEYPRFVSRVYHWQLLIRKRTPHWPRRPCCILYLCTTLVYRSPPNQRIWRLRTFPFLSSTRCVPGNLCLTFLRHSLHHRHKLWCDPQKFRLSSLFLFISAFRFCLYKRGLMSIPRIEFTWRQISSSTILMETRPICRWVT